MKDYFNKVCTIMDRVKFKVPEKEIFHMSMTLMVAHMNYGNHLGNDSVLTLNHEARVQWLRSLGHSELDIDGVGIIQSDAMVMYRSEGHLGQEVELKLFIGEFNSKMMNLYCVISDKESKKEIARIKNGLIFFDYEKKSITNVSDDFLKKL
jgi:4-hydroxybenzoyl-CoA thioesterase